MIIFTNELYYELFTELLPKPTEVTSALTKETSTTETTTTMMTTTISTETIEISQTLPPTSSAATIHKKFLLLAIVTVTLILRIAS